jgi:hypothetical protein
VIGALACAGLPLFAWGVQRGDISFGPLRDAATWATALFVALGSSLLLGVFVEPLGLASPTLPRLLWSGLSALLLLPFFASSEFLLRSEGRAGRWLPALARLVALLVFFVAAALGALPETAQLAVFALAPLFVGFEVAAQRLARRAPHPWLSALLQSAWASGVLCASAPLVG